MSDFPANVHFVTESDAPPVIVLAGSDDSERSSPPHSHRRGQLFGSTSGLLTVGLETGVWVVPATHAVWVPPYRLHWARSHGLFSGYAVYVAHDSCADLPAQPCSIRVSGLLREAVLRASAWPPGELDTRGERIAAVILDEIRTCPVDALGLPLPQDARLARIARAILDDPSDERSLEAWAAWGAISARSLSRRFVIETGFNFTVWRQRARLLRALEMLADEVPVTTVALQLGYSTPSTFIGLFKRTFGATPAVYRQRLRGVGEVARRADPA
jgi:AraC-like DNA-binding protein